jgi:hypothetical protein
VNGCARVNEVLATARAVGDIYLKALVPPDAEVRPPGPAGRRFTTAIVEGAEGRGRGREGVRTGIRGGAREGPAGGRGG